MGEMIRATDAAPAPGDRRLLVAIGGALGLSLTVGLLVNWLVGAAVLAVTLGITARPLDLFRATLALAAVATFVSNEGGHLTRDLSIVSLVVTYALLCLAVARAGGRWTFPRSELTSALLILALTTTQAVVHGLLAQHSRKFIALELLPMLALCSAPMVGGMRFDASDLRLALRVLVVVALIHVGLGVAAYARAHARTGGVAFTGIPGMVALIVLNVWLYGRHHRARLWAAALIAALLFHQIISFTRGYWLGLLVCVPGSCLLYVGRGQGMRDRAGEVVKLLVPALLLAGVCVLTFGALFGWTDLWSTLGSRIASSFATQSSRQTVSNIARLIEYRSSMLSIVNAPWLGHGLGFTLDVYQPSYGVTAHQSYIHQMYLLVWLKQGIVGLLALIGALAFGTLLGVRAAVRLTGDAAGWSAGVAACTTFLAVHCMTNMTLASVNGNFMIAFLWGLILSVSEGKSLRLFARRLPVGFS